LNLEFLQARFNGSAGLSDCPGNAILTSFDVRKDSVTRIQQLLEVLGFAAHWLVHCRLGQSETRGDPDAPRLTRAVRRWCSSDRRVGQRSRMSPEQTEHDSAGGKIQSGGRLRLDVTLHFPTRAERPGKLPHAASLHAAPNPAFFNEVDVLKRLLGAAWSRCPPRSSPGSGAAPRDRNGVGAGSTARSRRPVHDQRLCLARG
jgi:hypothetical protein